MIATSRAFSTPKWMVTVALATIAILPCNGKNYWPERRAFVCDNGVNRYTRALYGTASAFRVETSDRPVFAVYQKAESKNISFRVNGLAADSTAHCRAWYEHGMRSYQMRDPRWGKRAKVVADVVVVPGREAAIWRFVTSMESLDVEAIVSPIAHPKMQRSGDLGVDNPATFEADRSQPPARYRVQGGQLLYVMVENGQATGDGQERLAQLFETAEDYHIKVASRMEFNTPDPYINTLGGALMTAADGLWSGETWLHGCVGWRTPLPGWRAGYLGDVLGWSDRAVSHFDAYAKSQVTNVKPVTPHPLQDEQQHGTRAEKRWGSQMYSNGYICRTPGKTDQMHHYDMNLCYIDELLWHFQYDADKEYMRKMWPVLQRHLAWEKRNFDPDGDHLYDAYCCIWASDALYYSGGAVTHSSAYNYRANRLAARIAELIGENPLPYRREAEDILRAMNERLWVKRQGGTPHWAEYQDMMGLRRVHSSAAVWSEYIPIDCGVCTEQQAVQATQYIDQQIPHIPLESHPSLSLVATSNWQPYAWSINNVATAEVMHTALAYFQAGRSEEGFQLLKAAVMDQMYEGQSPANFGQLSRYDAARGECYRDFGDCIGIAARTLVQGLFGIQPDALYGRCILRPSLPAGWDTVSVHTPYLDYTLRRLGHKTVCEVTQHFTQPLKIVFRQNLGLGLYRDYEGTTQQRQTFSFTTPVPLPEPQYYSCHQPYVDSTRYGLAEPTFEGKFRTQNLTQQYNAKVTDIFQQEYRTPRPPYTTLQIPWQGVGDWCHPDRQPEIVDTAFRARIIRDEFLMMGVPFATPTEGRNIIFTSLWDNYPDSVSIPLDDRASRAWLLLAGSTNPMQSWIANGEVVAHYQDGTTDVLPLINPVNWCPIEQDYYVDDHAFAISPYPRPYRVGLATGVMGRDLGKMLGLKGPGQRDIPGGAAQMLCMPLNPVKRLVSLTVRTLSCDVVIGLMGVTLQ